jgi:transcriptional regulator NrdR family protein
MSDKAEALVNRVVQHLETSGSPDIENMTIKEIRLKALNNADSLSSGNDKASIMSVVVYVVVT